MAKLQAKVIVNPVAGACATRRKWPVISRLLKGSGLSFDFQYTEGAGHAIELAREAASDGYNCLVAVGGDGTVHEVANGILSANGASRMALGIVSTGTGSDFIRSVGIPRGYESACSALTSPGRRLIDAGMIDFHSQGQPQRRFFVNGAGVGFDAAVVAQTERLPKLFGGTIPYLFGVIRALCGYRNKTVEVEVGGKVLRRRILNVTVANGSYLGGGMRIAPNAELNDSQFDVVMVGDMGKLELLKEFPTVYKGTHLGHPKVEVLRTTSIRISSRERMLLHADGELLGEGPASFSVIPGALSLITQG